MKVFEHISLKPFNTFGIDARARLFVAIDTIDELREAITNYPGFLILGGGSNILLTGDVERPVFHLNLKGKEIIRETDQYVFVRAQAGENWHEFVLWCLEHNFGGIENLSLIPGNVGTSPMQNIGAYGVEIKDVLYDLEAMDIADGSIKTFTNAECRFGYRNSIFKNEVKGQYIITAVTFRLTKKEHQLNTSYGAIKSELEKKGISRPTIQAVSNAVIAIRQSKLPDPKELGNSGSFFKNPVIGKEQFLSIQQRYPDMPFYTVSDNEIKVPAGWLVEQCGFKGKRFGDTGVHKLQALVLVNYGQATGKEILELSRKIQAAVHETFHIDLEAEVNII
ncbi:MAG: UDP-N-acetylmuramate dehydrogenase [Flavobacteriaceae bacterium]|nr:UDP-N-acetylmuramate dehydrogenase [Flavobacteriaceae bacterium]